MIKSWHGMESPKAGCWKHLSVWEDHMMWKPSHCRQGPVPSSQGHPKMMESPPPPFHQPLVPGVCHAWMPSPDKGRGGRVPEEGWGKRTYYGYVCYIISGISGSTTQSSSSSSSSNSSSPPAHSSSEKVVSSLISVPR